MLGWLNNDEEAEARGEEEGEEVLTGGVGDGEMEGELLAVAAMEASCGAGCTLPLRPRPATGSEREERFRLSEW